MFFNVEQILAQATNKVKERKSARSNLGYVLYYGTNPKSFNGKIEGSSKKLREKFDYDYSKNNRYGIITAKGSDKVLWLFNKELDSNWHNMSERKSKK